MMHEKLCRQRRPRSMYDLVPRSNLEHKLCRSCREVSERQRTMDLPTFQPSLPLPRQMSMVDVDILTIPDHMRLIIFPDKNASVSFLSLSRLLSPTVMDPPFLHQYFSSDNPHHGSHYGSCHFGLKFMPCSTPNANDLVQRLS
jgi:hypothetical protein